jgi:hypothetical protein
MAALSPSRSEAQCPIQIVVLNTQTLSTDPQQVRFTFAVQYPCGGLFPYCTFKFLPLPLNNPASHILSCSASAPGWVCLGDGFWSGSDCSTVPVGTFDVVSDSQNPCFNVTFTGPVFNSQTSDVCFPDGGAVAVAPLSWGKLKAFYR